MKIRIKKFNIAIFLLILSMLLITVEDRLFTLVFPMIFFIYFRNLKELKHSKSVLMFFSLVIFTILSNIIINYFSASIELIELTKMSVNAFAVVSLFILFYCIGRKSLHKSYLINNVLLIFLKIFFINATINILVWFQQTGGVIARYNFISPVTQSVTGYIYLSVIGFFMSIVLLEKKYSKVLFCLVFFINVIIIINRQQQLLFIGYSLLFLSLYGKRMTLTMKTIRLFLITGVALVCIAGAFPYIEQIIPSYGDLVSGRGNDLIFRELTQSSSIMLFKQRPLTGVGYGMFGVMNQARFNDMILASSHSGFYDLIAEFGLVGIIFTLVLYVPLIKKSIKVLIINKSNLDTLATIFILGTIATTYTFHLVILPPANQKVYYIYSSLIWFLIGYVERRYEILTGRNVIKEKAIW